MGDAEDFRCAIENRRERSRTERRQKLVEAVTEECPACGERVDCLECHAGSCEEGYSTYRFNRAEFGGIEE